MREPRQARLKILNRAALAEEVRHLLRQFGDSQRRAAAETGIPQPQFSRLLNEELGEMGIKPFRQLEQAVGEERRAQLWAAFFPPHMVQCLTAYVDWVASETQRLKACPSEYWLWSFEGPVRTSPAYLDMPHGLYSVDLAELVDYWEKQCPASYHRFHREMDKLQVPDDRRELAMLRMLVPLLDARASAFVERGWDDLSREEFEAFADAGLKRELIILQRSSQLQRLQQVGPLVVGDVPATGSVAPHADIPPRPPHAP